MAATIKTRRRTNSLASFQSPIHRVNGCNAPHAAVPFDFVEFQSPIHRVNGCNKLNLTILDMVELLMLRGAGREHENIILCSAN